MLVQKIIRECGLPTAELARTTGISRAALNAWLAGKREPQPVSVRKLADGLAKRGEDLEKMAEELRRVA